MRADYIKMLWQAGTVIGNSLIGLVLGGIGWAVFGGILQLTALYISKEKYVS